MNKTIETAGGIPEQELVDIEASPISQEEMDAELQRMHEAQSEIVTSSNEKDPGDADRIEKLRRSIKEAVDMKTLEQRQQDEAKMFAFVKDVMKRDNNIEQPPIDGENKGDGGGDGENGGKDKRFRQIHESQTHYEYDPCPKCGGSGHRFFIFPCLTCGGMGTILKSVDESSSTKHIEVSASVQNNEEKPEENKLELPPENPENKQE
jgi:hypothetical protein